MRPAAVLLLIVLAAQGAPRKALADYPLHASDADFDFGIEYTVHSFSGTEQGAAGQMYLAQDFLVFEVAVFPKHPAKLEAGVFELSVNGSKQPIPQVQPEVVAMTISQPDWTTRPHLEASAGAGDIGVTAGRPRRTERFPGDQTAQHPLPKPPGAPDGGQTSREPVDAGALAIETALAPGLIATPRSGNIYFPWKGNATRIKKLVLHVSGGAATSDVVVK